MSTKLVVILLTLALLVSIRLFSLKNIPDSDKFSTSGQITSNPYLKSDNIVFYLGRYKISGKYQNLEYGDKVKITGRKKGFEVEANNIIEYQKTPLEQNLFNFRKNLESRINQHFPSPQAQLLSGVLLGIKTNLSREFKDNLTSTGTIHVVVVSGYNIILVASFLLLLTPIFGRKKTTILALVAILLYTFLVGSSAPTIRALIMGSIALIAILIGRKALALYTLFLTALIMLIFNPEFLFDISFQLSFAATLSVLIFTKFFETKLTRLPKFLGNSLATSLAAQILVMPLIFYYFGQVSLMSPVVNTLVLWTVPLCTIIGFVFLLASFLANTLADLISYILIFPLSIFTFVVEFFGKLKFLVLNLEKNNLVSTIGYYLIVLSISLKVFGLKLSQNKHND